MSVTKVLNAIQRIIPQTREFDWGDEVTNLLADVCDLLEAVLTIAKLTVKRISGPFQAVTATGGTTALDFALGFNLRVTLQASTTFTFANPRDGERYYFHLKQDATGGRTVTWPAAVKWRGGAAPTLSTAANARDVVALMYDATDAVYLGEFAVNFA